MDPKYGCHDKELDGDDADGYDDLSKNAYFGARVGRA